MTGAFMPLRDPQRDELVALARAYREHAPAIRRRLYRLGVRSVDIENLTQHVFETAMLHLDELPRQRAEAGAWLAEVARKVAANWHRRFLHKYEIQDEEALEQAIAEPEDTETAYALRLLVRQVLASLDPEDCELLVRRFLIRERWSEIAARLGLSRSGVYARVDVARERFVEALQNIVGCLYTTGEGEVQGQGG